MHYVSMSSVQPQTTRGVRIKATKNNSSVQWCIENIANIGAFRNWFLEPNKSWKSKDWSKQNTWASDAVTHLSYNLNHLSYKLNHLSWTSPQFPESFSAGMQLASNPSCQKSASQHDQVQADISAFTAKSGGFWLGAK